MERHTKINRAVITFHGGEPLLADRRDPAFYKWATNTLRNIVGEAIGPGNVRFNMQTNGTLITQDVLDRLRPLGIKIGVSIDGLPGTHNKYRKYSNGKTSYADVVRGIKLLQNPLNKDLYGGILCVIDPSTNPIHTYRTLMTYDPPSMDFLPPLAHYDMPPPRYGETESDTPYADWLIPIFELRRTTSKNPRLNNPRLRILDEIVAKIMGQPGTIEYFGTEAANVVIETNGEMQAVDAQKSTYHGAPATGLNVFENTFDDFVRHPKVSILAAGTAALSDTCRRCDIVEVCGGGYQPHRYREGSEGNGYKNPSVYSKDLKRLIGHIAEQLSHDLKERSLDALGAPR